MFHNHPKQNAYGVTSLHAKAPKRAEAMVFSKITALLKTVEDNKEHAFVDRANALHENRRLWLEVATSVADKDNQLPLEMKQRLFSLSVYVQNYSSKALNSTESLTPLIEINQSIIIGLSAQKEVAA